MADQTSVRGGKLGSGVSENGSAEGKVVSGIAEFINDIVALAELQAKLALLDLKECLEKARLWLALVVVGIFFILASLPVALFGVAELVAVALKISTGWALLMTGVVVLIVAGMVVVVSAYRLVPSVSSFRRSREELSRNLSWIRTVLLYSGRSFPRRSH
jgi:uncharacterized membrane protein YqjE